MKKRGDPATTRCERRDAHAGNARRNTRARTKGKNATRSGKKQLFRVYRSGKRVLREMGRAINKTETKREESKRERETSGRKDGSRFTRITQHLSRELALTLYISLSFIENISKNDASDTYIYI